MANQMQQKIRLAVSAATLIIWGFECAGTQSAKPVVSQVKARRIHEELLTLDSHCDTPLKLRRVNFDLSQRHQPDYFGGKVDFPRMSEGGLDAIFFAAYVAQEARTPEGFEQARQTVAVTLDSILSAVRRNSALAEMAYSPRDIYRITRRGKRAILLGIENGYPLGSDLSLVEKYYRQGFRYITLCHVKNNDICDSSNDTTEHGGLSTFGQTVVREMNRLGMLIDVSHISDSAFFQVLRLTKAPVIASHSCVRALCNNPRNFSDAMLQALARNGGVIQINIFTEYVKTPQPNTARDSAYTEWRRQYHDLDNLSPEELRKASAERDELDRRYPRILATVKDMVDHIDHVVQTIGIDHVGIGSDFDGGGALQDCYDVSQMGNITEELLRRGYSPREIAKIWSGNFLRVWKTANQVASLK